MTNQKAIVISPLNSIISEQVTKKGNTAIWITDTVLNDLAWNGVGPKTEQVTSLMSGKVTHIFGHPEILVSKQFLEIVRDNLCDTVGYVFVDEAHCVVNWGCQFRPDYQKLSKLKSVIRGVVFVAMTATATHRMQHEILEKLCMSKSTTVVQTSNIRANIKFNIVKRQPSTGKTSAEESFETIVLPLLKELCTDNNDDFPRTIVYSKLKYCALGYELAHKVSMKSNTQIMDSISQYHAPSTSSMKEKLVQEMGHPSSKLKLLFATEAYSMGTDAPNIRRIVHIGPPSSLDTYMQEVGRGGRDGEDCDALLYYNASDIGKNVTSMMPEVCEFCISNTCRRTFLGMHFGMQHDHDTVSLHRCCDICADICSCDTCLAKRDIVDYDDQLTSDQISLSSALSSYFDAENRSNENKITGLTDELLTTIIKSSPKLSSKDDVARLCGDLQDLFIDNIYILISTVTK
ncbi:hypothetical protein FSP39_006929 [Pinctada imbricata]|nr:hypothetical protein FSP39_006929 [Pinctada imbricata]